MLAAEPMVPSITSVLEMSSTSALWVMRLKSFMVSSMTLPYMCSSMSITIDLSESLPMSSATLSARGVTAMMCLKSLVLKRPIISSPRASVFTVPGYMPVCFANITWSLCLSGNTSLRLGFLSLSLMNSFSATDLLPVMPFMPSMIFQFSFMAEVTTV